MTEFYGKSDSFDIKLATEKSYIKKTGLAIGIAAIILAAVSVGFKYIVMFVATFLGVSRVNAAELLNNSGIKQFEQVVFSVLCFTLPFIAAARLGETKVSRLVCFKKAEKGTVLPYFLMGTGFCMFANFAVNRAGRIFESFGLGYDTGERDLPTGFIGILLFVISTALVPALVEEFGCRGVVLGLLKPMGEGFSVLVSAVIFSFLHGNFEQIPFAFLVGLALGVIRIKTGSLYVCMAVHFVNNGISCLLSYLFEYGVLSDALINTLYVFFMAILLILGVCGAFLLKEKGEINFKKSDCAATEKQKLLWFFLSPAIIIFIGLEIVNSLRYIVF